MYSYYNTKYKLDICKSTHHGMNETIFADGEISFTDVKWDLYLRPMINRLKIMFSIIICKKNNI